MFIQNKQKIVYP